MITLLIGGARSGKSALAERLAADSGHAVTVVATAQAWDEEMAARIAAHQRQRPAHWRTVEAPRELAAALQEADGPGRMLVVDCLTLWLSNLLLADVPADVDLNTVRALQPGPAWLDQRAALLATLPALQADVVLIGNEVGHGIVPMGALNRLFVDENGRLHQALAALSTQVQFVMAGCVLPMKG
ncbi:bifunctional adenosylcobinamide kinase/adenosylcobinamide-phosphate guanylyltransferase [Ideonella margarita]|uniref:Bifunctional adenosylcobalamin biosynthesis protein n=1 Tax=Ideonella margarita TaxID=2984191 RepID=A0ABU9C3J0_9BURK